MAKFLHVLRGALGHRGWSLVAAIAGMALVVPSLGIGLQLDDYVHRALFIGTPYVSPFVRSPLDIFGFLDGDAARTRRLVDLGLLPWWTLDTARLAFWRPVTAVTHWVDYRLWPDHPALMHVQSILWYGALVASVGVLYRRTMTPAWAAGLATILYAMDDAHGFAAGWVANRNATIGAFLAVLALVAHDRWRRERWRPGALLGPVLLLAGLLAAETTAAVGGYLLAYALFLERGTRRQRLGSLVPYAIAAVAWHVVYRLLGYGTFGAAPHYISPVAEPASFARALVERGPLVLLIQWGLPLEYVHSLTGSGQALWLGALGFLVVLSLAVLPLLRWSATARCWALGSLLAVVPLCATAPHERHLLIVGIGAMGLMAEFASGLVDRAVWVSSRAAWRMSAMAVGGVLLALHGLTAPFRLPSTSKGFEDHHRYMRDAADSLPDELGRTVLILNAPDSHRASLMHFYRLDSGRPMPPRIHRLGPGLAPMDLARADARTLVVRTNGFVLPEQVTGGRFPMAAGQRVGFTGFTAEVRTVSADGRPEEVAFRFDVPLEDPSLVWLAWRPDTGPFRYRPFELPRVGETRRLP